MKNHFYLNYRNTVFNKSDHSCIKRRIKTERYKQDTKQVKLLQQLLNTNLKIYQSKSHDHEHKYFMSDISNIICIFMYINNTFIVHVYVTHTTLKKQFL